MKQTNLMLRRLCFSDTDINDVLPLLSLMVRVFFATPGIGNKDYSM